MTPSLEVILPSAREIISPHTWPILRHSTLAGQVSSRYATFTSKTAVKGQSSELRQALVSHGNTPRDTLAIMLYSTSATHDERSSEICIEISSIDRALGLLSGKTARQSHRTCALASTYLNLDSKIETQEESRSIMLPSTTYLDNLVKTHIIPHAQHDTLTRLIKSDVAQASQLDSFTIAVPGKDVCLTRTVARRELEATARVLNTAELVEAILAQVPAVDLLRASLACKTFAATIKASHTTRRILHREPDMKAQNRLFPITIKNLERGAGIHEFLRNPTDGYTTGAAMLQDVKKWPHWAGFTFETTVRWLIDVRPMTDHVRNHPILSSIFLSQPPIKYMQLKIRPGNDEITVYVPGGATFGHIFHAMALAELEFQKRFDDVEVEAEYWDFSGWWTEPGWKDKEVLQW